MERNNHNKIITCIKNSNDIEMIQLLNSGLDPNFEGGWPIRLAARHGSPSVVNVLLQHGANPHLLSESGASTLQLAVYSREEWSSNKWTSLLSSCNSSQLADGAAVAIIFENISALEKILQTGRCNTNIPTTLTGKTVEDLAKGYKLHHLLNSTVVQDQPRYVTPTTSPRRQNMLQVPRSTNSMTPQQERLPQHSHLSPSVADFFYQTANQTSLTPPRGNIVVCSPTAERLFI